jgi:ferritin-like metal-binding protein YciE
MSLREVLIDELRDLYSAENQQIKAMPKVVKSVHSDELKQALLNHHEESKQHVERLREVFTHLGKKPTGKHCSGMEGAIDEVKEALEEDAEGGSFDAGIIGATARVEHYEIAGYTVAVLLAKALGETEAHDLLKQTLEEEKTASKNVLGSAKGIFKQALAEEGDEDEPEEKPKKAKEKKSEQESEKDEHDADAVLQAEDHDGAEEEPARKPAKKSASKK